MFNTMFTIVPMLMVIMIVFFIGSVIREKRYNDSQPKIPVEAKVVSRRSETSTTTDTNGINDANGGHNVHSTSTSTSYYVTFEFINGERIQFKVSGHEYGFLLEGDRGILTFQGRRYISFQRQ